MLIKRKAYPTDLTDKQWEVLKPHLPGANKRGAPRTVNLREIINALLYLARTGCQWRMLPHDLPPWQTVYEYFKKWRDDGTWEQINRELRIEIREDAGRDAQPSAAILDSQTVKGTELSQMNGYDAGKKINGIKRHTVVDTLGMILMVLVLPGNIQDPHGARQLLDRLKPVLPLPRLRKIWADGIYGGSLIDWIKTHCGWVLEIVKRSDGLKGFVVLPKRWVIERTFGWLNRTRRLSKHYERRDDSGEALVYIAMIHLMVKRLAHEQTCFA